MAKKTIYNRAYLRVNLIRPCEANKSDAELHFASEPWLSAAREAKRSVEQHCDVESVTIYAETELVCSFCGDSWTEESSEYNSGCCDKDEQDFQQKLSHASTKEGE